MAQGECCIITYIDSQVAIPPQSGPLSLKLSRCMYVVFGFQFNRRYGRLPAMIWKDTVIQLEVRSLSIFVPFPNKPHT